MRLSISKSTTSSDFDLKDIEKAEATLLPPTDGGHRAWSFLIGAMMIEGLLYGFPLLFGIFLEFLQKEKAFGHSSILPIIGPLSIGLPNNLSPLITPIILQYSTYRQHMVWAGWMICIIALILASFATTVWQLVFFQGVLFALEWLILYYPLLSMFNEWWVDRRGLASVILFSCEGTYGFALPLLSEKLLVEYGNAWTLRIYAIAVFVLIGPTLPFLCGRNPYDPTAPKSVKMQRGIFSKVSFTAISTANLFLGLVVFLPGLFFPSFATSIGISSSQGTLILSLKNVALFKNFVMLLISGIAFGLFAAPYSVLYGRFATSLTQDVNSRTWVYSVLECQRGVCVVLGGVFSGGLVDNDQAVVRLAEYGIGSYRTLILLVGISFAVSSTAGVGYFLEDRRLVFAWSVRMAKLQREEEKWPGWDEKPPLLPELGYERDCGKLS